MSKTIEKRIEAYKEATKNTNELESLKMLKKEVEYLLKTYKPASVRRYLTIYRKGLVNHLSVDVRAILTIPQNLQNKINIREGKRVCILYITFNFIICPFKKKTRVIRGSS